MKGERGQWCIGSKNLLAPKDWKRCEVTCAAGTGTIFSAPKKTFPKPLSGLREAGAVDGKEVYCLRNGMWVQHGPSHLPVRMSFRCLPKREASVFAMLDCLLAPLTRSCIGASLVKDLVSFC